MRDLKAEGTVPVLCFCRVCASFSQDTGSYGDEGGAAEGRGRLSLRRSSPLSPSDASLQCWLGTVA